MTEAEKIQMEIKQKEAEVLGLKKKLEELVIFHLLLMNQAQIQR